MPDLPRCGLCADFIKNQTNYRLPGKCKSFEEGKVSAKDKQIKQAFMARGNCDFLDCTRRICKVFKPLTKTEG